MINVKQIMDIIYGNFDFKHLTTIMDLRYFSKLGPGHFLLVTFILHFIEISLFHIKSYLSKCHHAYNYDQLFINFQTMSSHFPEVYLIFTTGRTPTPKKGDISTFRQ